MRCPAQRPHKRHRAAAAALESRADLRGSGARPRLAARSTHVPHMLLCLLGLLGTSTTAYRVAAQQPPLREGAPAAGYVVPEGHVYRAPAELEHATATDSKQLGFRTTSKVDAISSGEGGADAWTVSPGLWNEVELKLCDDSDTDETAINCTLGACAAYWPVCMSAMNACSWYRQSRTHVTAEGKGPRLVRDMRMSWAGLVVVLSCCPRLASAPASL